MSQEQIPEITAEDFKEWSNNPVTKTIINDLTDRKEMYVKYSRTHIREGQYHQATYYEGMIAGLDTILLISYEDV